MVDYRWARLLLFAHAHRWALLNASQCNFLRFIVVVSLGTAVNFYNHSNHHCLIHRCVLCMSWELVQIFTLNDSG